LLSSFAVFAVIPLLFRCYSAVIPLLLVAVFRCYLVAAGFKKPEFLRPGEVPPLYFPGIISGISERGHRRSNLARDRVALRGCGKNALHQGLLSAFCDGHHWSRRCPVS
jgi:hypothetical protein